MGANPLGDAALRNPTTGIAGCCARAASGHTARPRSVMNSRQELKLARSPCDSGSITNYRAPIIRKSRGKMSAPLRFSTKPTMTASRRSSGNRTKTPITVQLSGSFDSARGCKI
jgi:hypothetical protein